ncbi:hypothetical protein SH2C18_42070 [Clostridium sediminicola]|uniref:hypothetical protein n=1 Tax=Clostridium sediminicola TaxID=3114879 RepID=UPI0031F22B24
MKYDEKLLDALDKMEMNMEKLTEDELKRISALQKQKMNLKRPKSKKAKWKIKQFSRIAAACVIIVGGALIFIQSSGWKIQETNDSNLITKEDIDSKNNKDNIGIASIDNFKNEQKTTNIEPDATNQGDVLTSDDNNVGIDSIDDSNDQQNITSVQSDNSDTTKENKTDKNNDIGIASIDNFDSHNNTVSVTWNNFNQVKEILGYTVMIPIGNLDELSRGDIKVIDNEILEINYEYNNSFITYRTGKGNIITGSGVVDDNTKTITHNEILITIKENKGKRMFGFKKEGRSYSMDINGVISDDEIIKIIDSIRPY